MYLRGTLERELAKGAITAAKYAYQGRYTRPRGPLTIHSNPKPAWGRKYNASRKKTKLPRGRRGTICNNVAKYNNDIGTVRTLVVGNNILKGTDYGDRVGNRVFIRGITLQYQFTNISTSIADNLWVRFFLVLDKFHQTSVTTDMFMSHSDDYSPEDYVSTGNTLQLIDKLNP